VALLEVAGLSAWYGEARALWDVDLEVREGEVTAILGRNGAGKTTLLNSVARLHMHMEGSIVFRGNPIGHASANEAARAGITFVREAAQLPGSLTVDENIRLGQRLARLRTKPERTLQEVFATFPLLAELRHRKTVFLSGGQRQALALAVGYASRPDLMLLDEPSAGLAPTVAEQLFETIDRLADAGVSLLIVEQTATWLSDRVRQGYVLEVGAVIAGGAMDVVREAAMSGESAR